MLIIPTNFEYKVNEMTGNGYYVNLLNLLRKICEITLDELIFSGFYSLGASVSSREHSSGKIWSNLLSSHRHDDKKFQLYRHENHNVKTFYVRKHHENSNLKPLICFCFKDNHACFICLTESRFLEEEKKIFSLVLMRNMAISKQL